jgi:peptidoglycan/LPS O-acetylase OafA/YrhL
VENTLGLVIVVAFPLATVIAAFRAMRRWEGGWRTAARLPIIAIAGDLVFAYASNLANPGLHELWPYELMTVTAIGALFLIATASLRRGTIKNRRE